MSLNTHIEGPVSLDTNTEGPVSLNVHTRTFPPQIPGAGGSVTSKSRRLRGKIKQWHQRVCY